MAEIETAADEARQLRIKHLAETSIAEGWTPHALFQQIEAEIRDAVEDAHKDCIVLNFENGVKSGRIEGLEEAAKALEAHDEVMDGEVAASIIRALAKEPARG